MPHFSTRRSSGVEGPAVRGVLDEDLNERDPDEFLRDRCHEVPFLPAVIYHFVATRPDRARWGLFVGDRWYAPRAHPVSGRSPAPVRTGPWSDDDRPEPFRLAQPPGDLREIARVALRVGAAGIHGLIRSSEKSETLSAGAYCRRRIRVQRSAPAVRSRRRGSRWWSSGRRRRGRSGRAVAVEAALDRRRPTTNTGPAVPWSVPCEALAATRRPNSEYAISTTLRPWPVAAIRCRNAVTAASSGLSRRCWVPRSSAWVSKPPRSPMYTRVGTPASMQRAHHVELRGQRRPPLGCRRRAVGRRHRRRAIGRR